MTVTSARETTAAGDLVLAHMSLVTKIVRESVGRLPKHVNRDDLESAGLMALVNASKAYDASLGVPFHKYAARRVRGAVLDELRSLDWASRSVRRRARDIESTRARLAASMRRVPDDAEVAAELGLSVPEVQRSDDDLVRASVLSLDVDAELTFAEVLPAPGPTPDATLEHQERLAYLNDAVAALPERLRLVIRACFDDEPPTARLAERLGVSESRISQLRAEALGLLRDALTSALDPELVIPHRRPDGAAARRRDAYCQAVADRYAERVRPARPRRGSRASRTLPWPPPGPPRE